MNRRMSRLLKKLKLTFPVPESSRLAGFGRNAFMRFRGCVFLKREFKRSRVSQKHFPDKTGYECFVNHVHLDYTGTRRSAMTCLAYGTKLGIGLTKFAPRQRFQILASFSTDSISGCTVRFHLIRPGENWASDDLEAYKQEAILNYTAGEFRRPATISTDFEPA
jgi:hypothetical protein